LNFSDCFRKLAGLFPAPAKFVSQKKIMALQIEIRSAILQSPLKTVLNQISSCLHNLDKHNCTLSDQVLLHPKLLLQAVFQRLQDHLFWRVSWPTAI
jgi:hypothetical protein